MNELKIYAESQGLKTFGEDFYFGNLKGYSSALFTNPAGKQLTVNIRFSDPEQMEKLIQTIRTILETEERA